MSLYERLGEIMNNITQQVASFTKSEGCRQIAKFCINGIYNNVESLFTKGQLIGRDHIGEHAQLTDLWTKISHDLNHAIFDVEMVMKACESSLTECDLSDLYGQAVESAPWLPYAALMAGTAGIVATGIIVHSVAKRCCPR